ncbi:MAG TPA: RagB/SusD family nutrient uptake outer membrane protein [Puia sp.]|nr:RagB/SusD family nutrient uptake outer membrane protein [Puia sp.]
MRFSFVDRTKRLLLPLVLPLLLAACHKHFLDSKPESNLLIPTTISDCQSILDNTTVFNQVPTLGEASSDNYYFVPSYWMKLDTRQSNAYIWAADIFGGLGNQPDWNTPYQQVFYANVVLDGLGNKPDADSVGEWSAVKGEALFARAFAFYNISQIFAPPYDSSTANSQLGIPLRLHADIGPLSVRSSVGQTYQQIISDLDSAEDLLPPSLPSTNNLRNRPVKVCAQALLARVYLSMRKYAQAQAYADSALRIYPKLIDYNTLDTVAGVPIGLINAEAIYQANFLGAVQLGGNYPCAIAGGFYQSTRIDTTLIQSYDSHDLRRVVYYHYKPNDSSYLKGSYAGTNYCFGGLATDELYLIRAEGAARSGNITVAMNDIDTLLSKRWRTGTFPGYTVASAQEALDTVLLERRKELAFRGLRWTDLRRLNADGANDTLYRNLNGQLFTLLPNSNLYTLPIPSDVINLSGMLQNPR